MNAARLRPRHWLALFAVASLVGSVKLHAQTRDTPCSATTDYNAICLQWTVPTARTDGSAFPSGTLFSYRIEKQNGANWTTVTTVTTNTFLVTGLATGTHTFRVYAISPGGAISLPSNTASRTIEAAPTAPVLIIAAVIREGQAPSYRVVQRVRLAANEVVFVAPDSMRALFAAK